MSSSLGPSFKAKKRETPLFVTPDEIYLYEEKFYEINDDPKDIPLRGSIRYLNFEVNADGMIEEIFFSKEIESSTAFRIDKYTIIAGFERNDFLLMLKMYIPTN
jgi:hypothetical protein